jgi:SAM-dependent methyltransferase
MLPLTCKQLASAPYDLPEVLLLDTPTDDDDLTKVLGAWYRRAALGGTCLVYLRQPRPAAVWAEANLVAFQEVARDEEAVWYELRRSPLPDRFDQVAAFTGETRQEVLSKCHQGILRTKEAWDGAPTDTPADRDAFYATTDAYLYELVLYEPAMAAEAPDPAAAARQFELGHGTGGQMLRVARHGPVWGYDLSRVMRDFVRFRVPRYYPHLADRIHVLEEWDGLEPGSFDAVHTYHVLEHLAEPRAVLQHLTDLLRPGGVMHVIAPFHAVGPEYPEHNPDLAHLTVPELFAEVGLEVANTFDVGAWQGFVGRRS